MTSPGAAPAAGTERNRRRDLLIAYTDLVLEEGERAATLDAVAARAGVSKGGLLYHFPSQRKLRHGLAEFYLQQLHLEIEELQASGESPARWYLRTSSDYLSELERITAALVAIENTSTDEIRETLQRGRDRWADLIRDELGDDLTVVVIQLGDGIAYNAQVDGTGDAGGSPSEFGTSARAERLLDALHEYRASESAT